MKSNSIGLGLLIFAVAACNRNANEPQAENAAATNLAAVSEAPLADRDQPEVNALQPSNQARPVTPTPLAEPKGPIDPKSIEAAGQVIQSYGALIEQKKWTASRQYWADPGAAQAFERNFRTWKNVHLEIGDLGPAEGAAGSIFTNMPVRFYGDLNAGGSGELKGNVVLRRVNDVPGSTAAQRRWHIERIETR